MMQSKSPFRILILIICLFALTASAHAGGLGKRPTTGDATTAPATRVHAGGSFIAKLVSETQVAADIFVEDAQGKLLMQKAILLDSGPNWLKFKVEEMPAGAYFIKVKSAIGTDAITLVIQ